ncbi:hypothetical protein ACETRX_30755 [Labrys portucalensis]|uniref:Uncharacterized protein n=1 Tax=Labrys neptuniae TaxID=376174 RepID=A0ABV6ZPI6_9HYPH
MARSTYYVVLPFVRTQDGALLAIDGEDAASGDMARAQAAAIVGRWRGDDEIVGAIAFSSSGDPDIGYFDDAEILGRYGETPDDLFGMK